jgi:hypothetical protein
MTYKVTIRELKEAKDVPALQHILRISVDPQRRAAAAQALGQLLDLEASQSLIRTFLEDEDESVRQAARLALDALLGNRAEEAIAVYQRSEEGMDDEGLLEDVDPDEEIEALDPPMHQWDSSQVQALVTLAKASPDAEMRLKAVQQLSKLDDLTALDALFSIALWSLERKVRDAASQALMELYGDDYARMLESYRDNQHAVEEWELEEAEDFSGEEDEEDDEEEEVAAEIETPATNVYAYTGTPVVQEEGSSTFGRVLIYVAVIVIALVVLMLIIR